MQEIGIRMALGADQEKIMRLVLGQGMRLAMTGTAIGLAGAYGLTRLLANFLFGVKPSDPLAFSIVAVAPLGSCSGCCESGLLKVDT